VNQEIDSADNHRHPLRSLWTSVGEFDDRQDISYLTKQSLLSVLQWSALRTLFHDWYRHFDDIPARSMTAERGTVRGHTEPSESNLAGGIQIV
jgi:hypothetical protein